MAGYKCWFHKIPIFSTYTALLPLQMAADMIAVEKQFEDVPHDLKCYVDSEGHTYDFGYGLNWKGVIKDARTAKYKR